MCAEECVLLYDIFEDHIFGKMDYSLESSFIPLWTLEAGCDEESPLSKDNFETLRKTFDFQVINKMLFFSDTNLLIAALQDRFAMIEESLDFFYRGMTYPMDENMKYDSAVRNSSSMDAIKFSNLYSIFVYMCSAMDLITKIVAELETIDSIKYDNYPKMKSRNVLYNRNLPFLSKFTGKNIFTKNNVIDEIQEIRNRIVHNGGFGYRQWIYEGFSDNVNVQFILLPDMENGRFVKSKNRANFYSQGRTANNYVIKYVHTFAEYFYTTIKQIVKIYPISNMANKELSYRYIRHFTKKYSKAMSDYIKEKAKEQGTVSTHKI